MPSPTGVSPRADLGSSNPRQSRILIPWPISHYKRQPTFDLIHSPTRNAESRRQLIAIPVAIPQSPIRAAMVNVIVRMLVCS